MKKLAAYLLVPAFALAFVPVTASAQNNSDKDQKQIKRFFTKLKKLPNASSRPAPVISLARKLVKLDPKKAKRYYKTATIKFITALALRKSTQLDGIYNRLLVKAAAQGQISNAIAKRNIRQVAKILSRIIEPIIPTPTPYQA
jgi:hypothetical protein